MTTAPTSGDERSLAAALREMGAIVKLTKKGRIHTIDFRPLGDVVSDDDLARIEHLEHIRELYLAGTAVTAAGIQFIEGLTSLTTLDIENTPVGDSAMLSLRRHKVLKLLLLRGSQVTDEGVAQLRQAMLKTRIVHR